MKFCDLHTHSLCSDGTLSPAEIVAKAEEIGLGAVALTDHNTSKGLSEFMEAGKHSSVITVPGCEFSTETNGREIHIVGLFFKEEVWPEIEDFVDIMRIAKKRSNEKLVEALRADGYDVSCEEAIKLTGGYTFNRSHVGRILVDKGYFTSMKDAFDHVLSEGQGYYDPPKRLGSLSTIRFIRMYGAVAVLAHPFLDFSYEELLDFLPLAKEAGLDAMETDYSLFDEETTAMARELAERFGLKRSGGSDFHGEAKKNISLGTGTGNLRVPFGYCVKLSKIANRPISGVRGSFKNGEI